MRFGVTVAVTVIALGVPRVGGAGEPNYFKANAGESVVVVKDKPRTQRQRVLLVSLAAGTVLLGASGVYFHKDYNEAAKRVAAPDFTGLSWSREKQDDYSQAVRASWLAGTSYVLATAGVIATVWTLIATDPGTQNVDAHMEVSTGPHFTPLHDGGTVGVWGRF